MQDFSQKMFFGTSTYTATGKKRSAAARERGVLFAPPEAGTHSAETPSAEPGTPAAVTGVERDCHFHTTIHPARKQLSQTGLVSQTLKIPGFPPQAQKGCRYPPQAVTWVLQVFTLR